MTAANDTWRGRKGEQFSAKEWVGFWLPGCSLEVVEEPESRARASVESDSAHGKSQAVKKTGVRSVSK